MGKLRVEAWPFLVSRNSQLDYRPLVAHPSFLEKEVSFLLAEAVGGVPTPPDSAIYREIHHSPVGDVTLIFRVLLAERRFVDLPGSDPLSDQFGRAIKIFEGMVLEGFVPHITVTKKDFQAVHEYIEPVYQNFWQEGKKRFPVQPSRSFYLSSESETNPRLELLIKAPLVMELAPTESPPVPEKREDEPDQVSSVPQTLHMSEWERRYRRIRILIGILLVLLMIGVVVLLVTFHVLPFFPTPPHSPTPSPTSPH